MGPARPNSTGCHSRMLRGQGCGRLMSFRRQSASVVDKGPSGRWADLVNAAACLCNRCKALFLSALAASCSARSRQRPGRPGETCAIKPGGKVESHGTRPPARSHHDQRIADADECSCPQAHRESTPFPQSCKSQEHRCQPQVPQRHDVMQVVRLRRTADPEEAGGVMRHGQEPNADDRQRQPGGDREAHHPALAAGDLH